MLYMYGVSGLKHRLPHTLIVSFIIVGAKVLYRLHPDQQDKAVALVTTLPSQPSKEALKVRPHLLVITLTTCFR